MQRLNSEYVPDSICFGNIVVVELKTVPSVFRVFCVFRGDLTYPRLKPGAICRCPFGTFSRTTTLPLDLRRPATDRVRRSSNLAHVFRLGSNGFSRRTGRSARQIRDGQECPSYFLSHIPRGVRHDLFANVNQRVELGSVGFPPPSDSLRENTRCRGRGILRALGTSAPSRGAFISRHTRSTDSVPPRVYSRLKPGASRRFPSGHFHAQTASLRSRADQLTTKAGVYNSSPFEAPTISIRGESLNQSASLLGLGEWRHGTAELTRSPPSASPLDSDQIGDSGSASPLYQITRRQRHPQPSVLVGMASINARKTLFTASGVVKTSDTSGSKATTRRPSSTRDANRFGFALV